MSRTTSPSAHSVDKAEEKQSRQQQHGAIERLKRLLPPGITGPSNNCCETTSHSYWAAVLLAAIFLVPLFFIPAVPVSDHSQAFISERHGDFATIALDVEYAKHGLLLTGPYSRFTFNHPSPLLGYWYAIVEWSGLFGTDFDAYAMAQALWNQLWLLIAGVAIFCTSGSLILAVALNSLAFTILPFAAPDWLTSIWGPATTLTPTIALVVCVSAVLQGQLRFFLPATASACAAVASHIGGVPLVAPLWLVGALAFLRSSDSERRREIILPLLLIFGWFFALPLLEIISTENYGNFGKFLRFLNKPRPILGLQKGLSFIWNLLTQRFNLATPFTTNALFLLLIPIIIGALQSRIMLRRIPGSLLACSLIGWIGLAFAACRIVAEPQTYLVWVMWSLVATTMLSLMVGALHTPLLRRQSARAVLGILFFAILIRSLPSIQRPFDQEPRDPTPINRFIHNLPTPVEVRPAKRGEWDATAMVLRALVREHGRSSRGKVCVPRQWYFMYRRILACPERPQSVLLVWRTKRLPTNLTEGLQPESHLKDPLVTVIRADPAAIEASDQMVKGRKMRH